MHKQKHSLLLLSFSFVLSTCLLTTSCYAGNEPVENEHPGGSDKTTLIATYPDSQIYGSYAGGCIANAMALSDFSHFQVIRASRDRFYSHPTLRDFFLEMDQSLTQQGVGVYLIGDVSMPKGGPMPWGHRSHQVGLDADILFRRIPEAQSRPLTYDEREAVQLESVLTSNRKSVDPNKWLPDHTAILKTASENPRVERIFVNTVIKKHLCKTENSAAWLRKLRPWTSHDAHFHVRISCPPESTNCVKQAEVPPGSGCQNIMADAASIEASDEHDMDHAEIYAKLPAKCKEVLK